MSSNSLKAVSSRRRTNRVLIVLGLDAAARARRGKLPERTGMLSDSVCLNALHTPIIGGILIQGSQSVTGCKLSALQRVAGPVAHRTRIRSKTKKIF